MASVTQVIKRTKQPYGGYLKVSEFTKIQLNDNQVLKDENIHSSLVGMAVDYLTRLMLGASPEDAFEISLLGAQVIKQRRKAITMLEKVNGLDRESIYYACKLVGYDVCYRSGRAGYKPVSEIKPDDDTIDNIRIMVERSLAFFEKYGPIIKDGFRFEGGYTSKINTGDGDFLTNNTLWDFKVSKNNPNSKQTLQLLIYYIMGCHSIHNNFQNIKNIGIYNPRLNVIYLKNVSEIPEETIKTIETEIIGYGDLEINQTIIGIIFIIILFLFLFFVGL